MCNFYAISGQNLQVKSTLQGVLEPIHEKTDDNNGILEESIYR